MSKKEPHPSDPDVVGTKAVFDDDAVAGTKAVFDAKATLAVSRVGQRRAGVAEPVRLVQITQPRRGRAAQD